MLYVLRAHLVGDIISDLPLPPLPGLLLVEGKLSLKLASRKFACVTTSYEAEEVCRNIAWEALGDEKKRSKKEERGG